MKLTELEKTIMLVFLVFTKNLADKVLSEEFILSKFTPRQRKMVGISLRKLVKNGLLKRKGEYYTLTDSGLKQASRLLHEGAKLWKIY